MIHVINEYTSWVSLGKRRSVSRGFLPLIINEVYENKDEDTIKKRKEKVKARGKNAVSKKEKQNTHFTKCSLF